MFSIIVACGGRAVIDDSSSSRGGGAAGSSTTGGAIGSSMPDGGVQRDACATNADCPAPKSRCSQALCRAGQCAPVPSAEGSLARPHQPADCLEDVCDGLGNVKSVPDVTNVPRSTNPCIATYCDVNGVSYLRVKPMHTFCGSDSAPSFCDEAGNCVSCVFSTDCTPEQICDPSHNCVSD